MAKPLVVTLGGAEFPLNLAKVERSDLYGFIEVETLDEQGRKCTLATLADDGRTLIGTSGSALATLSADGQWLDRKSLKPVDNQGQPITPVPSSYAAPVALQRVCTIEDFLSHNIRSVYQVSSETDLGTLIAELRSGAIYQFPYSFRGGLEPDAGFLLLAADGTPFVAIGSPTRLEMVGLQQSGATAEDESETDDEDAIDFSMM
ncbi:MAG TPA: hypothetical protein VFF65_12995 [Phycisphaerales bacterium]|nr:hypothetical protein [Phycisphaerales bacterium]